MVDGLAGHSSSSTTRGYLSSHVAERECDHDDVLTPFAQNRASAT